ncbi:MAG: hypothetical protein JXA97_00430 [Anaerolineales bacterium]|nr:hypothetical protein [Anaerolineales bacterium]
MKRKVLIPIGALLVIFITTACLFSEPNPSPEINVACDVQELINYMDWANGDPRPITLILEDECLYDLTAENNLIGRHGDTTGESGANGLPPVLGDLTIIGNDALIRRSYTAGTPAFRIFFVASSGNLTIDLLLFENGYSTYGGGAIYVDGGTLLIEHSEAYGHETTGAGGAILNEEGIVTLRNTSLIDNTAVIGGAVSNTAGTLSIEDFSILMGNEASLDGGAVVNRGSLSIDGSRIINSTAGRTGGGIFSLLATSSIALTDVIFEDNIAIGSGGAIAAFNAQLSVSGTYFARNQGLRGGAIRANENAVSILNGTFIDNIATESGGAIFTVGSEITIDESIFSGNTGLLGGGIVNYGLSNQMAIARSSFISNVASVDSGGAIFNNSSLNIDSCTFQENEATYGGGGIYNNNIGDAVIINSTFSANLADGGGGLYNGGALELVSATFAYNDAVRGAAIWSYYTGTIALKNVIVADNIGNYPCDISGETVTGVFLDTTATCPGFTTSDDPLLKPLTDNGGPTLTHALSAGSPAIDTATDCTDLQNQPLNNDQRGVSRPYPPGGFCDPGAFEFDLSPPAPPPAEPTTSAGFLPNLCAPQNTTCREGPDLRFEAAGYLMAGECSDITGLSEDGLWYVIPNPDWQGDCFVAGRLVDVSGPTGDLPIIIGPPLPAPTETPVLGCLVRPRSGGEPVCTVPCPTDADPGDPCTP